MATEYTYTATLTAPNGSVETFVVDAMSKTEARKKIARLYRRDPSPRYGFYSFSQQRLEWVKIQS